MAQKGWFDWLSTNLKIQAKLINPDPTFRVLPKKNDTENYEHTTDFEINKDDHDYKVKSKCTYFWAVLWVFLWGMFFFISILSRQEKNNTWTTKNFRVHFDTPQYRKYNGCYERSKKRSQSRRFDYEHINATNATFKYCRQEKQWVFLTSQNPETSPCDASESEKLARSSSTIAFDISTDFDGSWRYPNNKPANLIFNEENQPGYIECGFQEGNGRCDDALNEPSYQYDGGDCCATTCSGSMCGKNVNKTVFGVKNETDALAFHNCKNHLMDQTLSITVQSFQYKKQQPDRLRFQWLSWPKARAALESGLYSGAVLEVRCNQLPALEFPLRRDMEFGEKEEVQGLSTDDTCQITLKTLEPLFDIDIFYESTIIDVAETTENIIPANFGNITITAQLSRLNLSKFVVAFMNDNRFCFLHMFLVSKSNQVDGIS
jgi:hypothetical protein